MSLNPLLQDLQKYFKLRVFKERHFNSSGDRPVNLVWNTEMHPSHLTGVSSSANETEHNEQF